MFKKMKSSISNTEDRQTERKEEWRGKKKEKGAKGWREGKRNGQLLFWTMYRKL